MADLNFADLLRDTDADLETNQITWEVLPEADYDCEITGAEIKTSAAGNNYIAMELKVDGKAKKVWYNLSFSDSVESRRITVGTLRSLGLDPAELIKHASDPDKVLSGKRVKAHIYIDQWNGEDRNYVKYVNPIKGFDYTTDLGTGTEKANESELDSPF